MKYLAECGRLTAETPRCAVCSRRIRCVFAVADEGWTFLLGRRCYAKLQRLLTAEEKP